MRVVLDTNILVRVFATSRPGAGADIVRRLRAGEYTAVYSLALLEEVVEVLSRPRMRRKYGVSEEDIKALLDMVFLRCDLVVPTESVDACRDVKDNKVLEVALAAGVDYVVTADRDLLVLDPFCGIGIITPSAFLERLVSAFHDTAP